MHGLSRLIELSQDIDVRGSALGDGTPVSSRWFFPKVLNRPS